LREQDRI
jgi:hypothetical protein